jgi:diadenosine tetraphosphate (Ap4A) HIT family hydrolase
MNATLTKFGYPANSVAEYDTWVVLLRPQQVTLGSLVLVCKEPVTSFGAVSAMAGADLTRVTHDLELALARCFHHDKINYLMLMMVDPDVHFHVLPRYASQRQLGAQSFIDHAWPGPPQLDQINVTDIATNTDILATLRAAWLRS